MPQEFNVVQCFGCEAYQVDIVKKAQKWTCKVCGEKQSLKQVFLRGNAKECRVMVQKLNQNRLESTEDLEVRDSAYNSNCNNRDSLQQVKEVEYLQKVGKWGQFADHEGCNSNFD